MRPNTLAEAVARIQAGQSREIALAEFVYTFDLAPSDADRYAAIEREPELTGDIRLDALVGAMAEYLAKQRRLGRVPSWADGPAGRAVVHHQFLVAGDEGVSDLRKSRRILLAQHLHRLAAPAAAAWSD